MVTPARRLTLTRDIVSEAVEKQSEATVALPTTPGLSVSGASFGIARGCEAVDGVAISRCGSRYNR